MEDGAATVILNSTVSHNIAGAAGGGVYVEEPDPYGNSLYVSHSIISQNTAATGAADVYFNRDGGARDATGASGGSGAFHYHVFIAAFNVLGEVNAVPDYAYNNIYATDAGVAGTLQDLGGPTMVLPLLAGSPAINAGDPGFGRIDFDQRGPGFDRVKGGVVDIGAFETTDANNNGIPDWMDTEEVVPVPTLSAVLLGALSSLLALLGLGSLSKRNRRER